MSEHGAPQRWSNHPVLARLLRVIAWLAPIVLSVVVTSMVSRVVARPSTTWWTVVWWVAMATIATVVLVLADRLARRLLPLAALLHLSLVFPDRAPSRFRAAIRTGTVHQLQRRIDEIRTSGLPTEPVAAAETLIELVSALSAHDRLTRGHAERVRAYSRMIGEELGLSDADLDRLHWAGLLHDVGKLFVPAEILNTTSRLTDEEFEIIKRHPGDGARLCEPLRPWLGDWVDAVGEHHERWDGRGYPNGLAGDDITHAGRIVAVADVFDVITSARSYKTPQAATEARAELARCAGTQFDPAVVRAFLSISLGRLRLAMGPLSWLAQLPGAARIPVAPVAGSVATGLATAVTLLAGGLLDASAPERPAIVIEVAEPSAVVDPVTVPSSSPTTTAPADEPAAAPAPSTTAMTVSVPTTTATTTTTTSITTTTVPATTTTTEPIRLIATTNTTTTEPPVVTTTTTTTTEPMRLTATTTTTEPPVVTTPPVTSTSTTTVSTTTLPASPPPPPPTSATTTTTTTTTPTTTTTTTTPTTTLPVVAVDDSAQTPEDAAVDIDVAANDGGVAVALAADAPSVGTVDELGSGWFRFTPPPDWWGTATFTYHAFDAAGTDHPATVTIVVTPEPDDPIAVDDVATVPEDGTIIVTVLGNDSDPDGDPLTVIDVSGDDGVVTTDGITVTYIPNGDTHGTQLVTYRIDDGTGRTATATVTVDVMSMPDAPVAVDDGYTVLQDQTLVVIDGVLVNDGDEDGDPLTATIETLPSSGSVTLAADGTFVYTPNPGFLGIDRFDYRVHDGTGLSSVGTVSIAVTSTTTQAGWYLGTSGSAPDAWFLTTTAPASTPIEPDHDGDGLPGFTIAKGDQKLNQDDPTKYQHWDLVVTDPFELSGAVDLELWSSAEDFDPNDDLDYSVWLLDCDTAGTGCTTLASVVDVHVDEWNGGVEDFVLRTIRVGVVDHTVQPGRMLRLRLMFNHHDAWIALSGDRASRLLFSVPI